VLCVVILFLSEARSEQSGDEGIYMKRGFMKVWMLTDLALLVSHIEKRESETAHCGSIAPPLGVSFI
jgi:hypothetical protein